ncbi:ribonuclease activity regulator RraA [Allonocardiopsis opalescens]|uniref:Putative 4-hydroxy-4-methyl-2-oxoglutarate aldolase n=1 Tax=Allonocardiopsis opalescens TaxID=1144618 RepID=A0A2T0Q2L2_9ACTN|nr:ribonuclease activity regulator RraA [Allonocardiopsis opalescens]PRX98033.1 regulator of RNase E activity RraA [Allonocardiopsis opalescens]
MSDTAPAPVDPAVIEALRAVSTATITTQLMDRGLRNTFLEGPRQLNPATPRMVGPAFTLRYIPAREDVDVLAVFKDYDHPQRRAVEQTPPGAVLVIDARGQTRAASLGHILATRLRERGAAGVVTDGAVRDMAGFAALDLPAFAAGAAPTTNLAKHHAVDLQQPIACGEVGVYPGDIIVGDHDGVVCVPRHLAAEVARAGVEQERLEDFVLARIEEGRPLRGTYPPDEATLREYRERG